jgi:ATP-dependent Clp protease ATP-binding subunit ClpC
MISDLRRRLVAQGMSIELSDAARDLVANKGTDKIYGARPLRRAIQTLIEDPLAEELLQGSYGAGDIISVDVEEKDGEKELVFSSHKGDIPKLEERTHLDAPRARERWSEPTPTPPSGGMLDSAV